MSRFQHFISEKYLPSQVKFGFELEVVVENSGHNTYDTNFEEATDLLTDIYRYHFGTNPGGVGADESIKPTEKNAIGAELNSHVMNATPNNLQKMWRFLSSLDDERVTTNSTCGFHIHFSFPDFKQTDAAWIICYLATDKVMQEEFFYLQDSATTKINLFSDRWSNTAFLSSIDTAIENDNIEKAMPYFSTAQSQKYQLMRVHPQGTIEWRGPRDFIKDKQLIKDMIIKMWKFVKFCIDALAETKINNITRKHFNEVFDDTTGKYSDFGSKNKKTDFRFTVDTKPELIGKAFKIAPWLQKAELNQCRIELSSISGNLNFNARALCNINNIQNMSVLGNEKIVFGGFGIVNSKAINGKFVFQDCNIEKSDFRNANYFYSVNSTTENCYFGKNTSFNGGTIKLDLDKLAGMEINMITDLMVIEIQNHAKAVIIGFDDRNPEDKLNVLLTLMSYNPGIFGKMLDWLKAQSTRKYTIPLDRALQIAKSHK